MNPPNSRMLFSSSFKSRRACSSKTRLTFHQSFHGLMRAQAHRRCAANLHIIHARRIPYKSVQSGATAPERIVKRIYLFLF